MPGVMPLGNLGSPNRSEGRAEAALRALFARRGWEYVEVVYQPEDVFEPLADMARKMVRATAGPCVVRALYNAYWLVAKPGDAVEDVVAQYVDEQEKLGSEVELENPLLRDLYSPLSAEDRAKRILVFCAPPPAEAEAADEPVGWRRGSALEEGRPGW